LLFEYQTNMDPTLINPYSSACGNRMDISTVLREGASLVGQSITIAGWVKTGRQQENNTILFLELNDGTTQPNYQVLVRKELHDLKILQPTGTSVVVTGDVVAHPKQEGVTELHATNVSFVGECNPAESNGVPAYPLAKGRHPLEHLRTIAHLRARSNTISAVARVRNALAFATHRFFQENGFLYVHTPCITASDCEGAGEMFQVTTLMSRIKPGAQDPAAKEAAAALVAEKRSEVETLGNGIRELKAAEKPDKKAVKKSVNALNAAKAELKVGADHRETQICIFPPVQLTMRAC
jgi:asparaginyl-tRNA synthetase